MAEDDPHDDDLEPTGRAPLTIPPEMSLDAAARAERFLVMGEHANLWFEGRSDVLIISFDNLATIDEGWPRGPWLSWRLEPLGHSVLGVQSHAKNWFRQPDAPAMLRGLEERGFFRRFRKIVMVGASMGGFAALNFAPLIPGARVLAFSPQSTMNKVIAPFEARFPFAVRKSNWEGMPFLDAAAAVPYIRKVVLLYDPFVPEDRAHAARLAGPNVQFLQLDHCTHEAIRVVIKSEALLPLIEDLIQNDRIGPAFWRAFRGRKTVSKWQRALLANAAARQRPGLVFRAADKMLEAAEAEADTELTFARRARRHAAKALSVG
jgi:pimeloyl-ACP methyl ester carboxylesterase